jgi:small-conductance mechanosensitive channel
MRKGLALAVAILVFAAIHEGTHAFVAAMYGEYDAFHVRPIGLEITFRTPVDDRSGVQWVFISGASNLVTLFAGYLLLLLGERFTHSHAVFLKVGIYYLTVLSLLADAFNLSVGPFLYGGDANGIAVGLGISRYVIQAIFFIVLLVNRELVAQRLLPMYDVQTRNPLFRPWVKLAD